MGHDIAHLDSNIEKARADEACVHSNVNVSSDEQALEQSCILN